MNTWKLVPKIVLVSCTAFAALGLGGSATAEVLNFDFQGDPPNDTIHNGADGVLSATGVVWNGILTGVDAVDLLDDTGITTEVDVVFVSTGGGSTDEDATNDLQDSGTFRTFDVLELDESSIYDVAIYASPFSLLRFTDSSGATSVLCNGTPTYALPGTLMNDYCLFLDVSPTDLGGGLFGFTFESIDGVIMGVQIERGGSPSVPALDGLGLMLLVLGMLGAAAWSLHARRATRSTS